MRNATRILLTATGLLTASTAGAQGVQAPAGQAYTIISNADATAVNPITYQWYRDNGPIPGATNASYTVPAIFAYGDNVQFYRLAKTQDCTGDVEKKSNTVTITFTGYIMPVGCNLVVGGTCWADCNVDDPRTFATRADMYTKFYQWNRLTAYSVNNPLTPAWNSVVDSSETWTNNPCPSGWRMPSQDEFQQLVNAGSTWAETSSGRGNIVPGRFYGFNHATCKLPSNMSGCIFFPAGGYRSSAGGSLSRGIESCYWSDVQFSIIRGYHLDFTSNSGDNASNSSKALAASIRCVK